MPRGGRCHPSESYNFRSIGDIESMETNSIIDVIGVVSSISPTGTIMKRKGFCNAEGQKLQSLCDSGEFPVLAVKAGGSASLMKLKEWFAREGRSAPCISISREFTGGGRVDVRKTISQIKDEKLGTSEKPDWITVNATILYMKVDNFYYTVSSHERSSCRTIQVDWHEHNDEEKFEDIIRKVAFTKYIFKLKVKEETYGDEPTVKAT
ncbi:hypothetical protein HID58_094776, partial [Brassica napus]